MNNGQVIDGAIVGQSRTEVQIRTSTGTRRIPKDQIRRLMYGDHSNTPAPSSANEAENAEARLRARQAAAQERAQELRQEKERLEAEEQRHAADRARYRRAADALERLQPDPGVPVILVLSSYQMLPAKILGRNGAETLVVQTEEGILSLRLADIHEIICPTEPFYRWLNDRAPARALVDPSSAAGEEGE